MIWVSGVRNSRGHRVLTLGLVLEEVVNLGNGTAISEAVQDR